MNLTGEYDTDEKPVDMYVYNNNLYILSAGLNHIQILNTETDDFIGEIALPTENGFPNKFYKIKDEPLLLVTDSANAVFHIIDLNTSKLISTQKIDEPVANLVMGEVIRKFNDNK